MARKPTLAWCSPNYGTIDTQVYKSHLAAIANASRTFDIKFVGISDKMYLHTASNELVRGALMEGVDYVFWTEQDMLLPFDAVTRLFHHDKDICSGVYFLRGASYMPCLWMFIDNPQNNPYVITPVCMFTENHVMKIDVCGFGCVLIKTDVFREISEPWFDMKEGYGQDVYFYRKMKDAGKEVWCDTGVQCGQQSDKIVTSIDDYRKHIADINTEFKGFVLAK